MSNPHYAEASRLSMESSLDNDWPAKNRLIIATRAQAEATLALAYAQDTANLIAVLGQVGEQTYEWLKRAQDVPTSDEAKQLARYKSIGQQVEERLGLA